MKAEREALEFQASMRAQGEQPLAVVPLPVPREPTKEERAAHGLTRCPPAPWCEHCILGQGAEDPHRRVPEKARGSSSVQVDWGFTGEGTEAEKDMQSTLVVVDRDSHMMSPIFSDSKVATPKLVKGVCDFVTMMSHQIVDLKQTTSRR